jgi:hypothetical protein
VQEAQENSLRWLVVATLPHGQIVKVKECTRSGKRGERPRVSPGSAARFYRYCESVQQFVEEGSNHRVHQRLTYVLLSCPAGATPEGKSFQALAEEAFALIPPNA